MEGTFNTNPKSSQENSEKIELEKEFKKVLQRRGVSLERSSKKHKFNFGPIYHIENSNGEKFTVEVFIINYSTLPDDYTFYSLVAKNVNGDIVGLREQRLQEGEAKGNIITGVRGKGISTLLDIVLQDILQREASKRKIAIDWTISDQNGTDLKNLRDSKGYSKDLELEGKIENKNLDRKRWKSLYSHEGMFGFNKKGVKTIEPKLNQKNDIKTIKDVIMKRTKEQPLGEVESLDIVDDINAYMEERQKDLIKTLKRMKDLAK